MVQILGELMWLETNADKYKDTFNKFMLINGSASILIKYIKQLICSSPAKLKKTLGAFPYLALGPLRVPYF